MIKPWTQGETITAARLNESVDLGNDVARAVFGTASRRPTPANAIPFPCTVVSIEADYLVCRPINITGAGADFYVAKPWELQQTPFDTKTLPNKDGTLLSYAYTDTQARTVTDTTDDSTEDQVIVPAYVPAQTISDVAYTGTRITVQRVAFGTGVAFAGSGGMTVEVEFEDMNRAGRAWAEDNG